MAAFRPNQMVIWDLATLMQPQLIGRSNTRGNLPISQNAKRHPKVPFLKRRFREQLLATTTETFFEAIDTAACVSSFLLTSVERVTCRTYVQVHSTSLSRFSSNNVTARTRCYKFFVLRVNTFTHDNNLCVFIAATYSLLAPLFTKRLEPNEPHKYRRDGPCTSLVALYRNPRSAHNTRALRDIKQPFRIRNS